MYLNCFKYCVIIFCLSYTCHSSDEANINYSTTEPVPLHSSMSDPDLSPLEANVDQLPVPSMSRSETTSFRDVVMMILQAKRDRKLSSSSEVVSEVHSNSSSTLAAPTIVENNLQPVQSLSARLEDIIQSHSHLGDQREIENDLLDFIQTFHMFEPFINRCAEIMDELTDASHLGIEKYVRPRSFVSYLNVATGLLTDTAKITISFYPKNRWLGGVLIGLALCDGGVAAGGYYLDSKIEQNLKTFASSIYEDVASLDLINKEVVVKAAESLTSILNKMQKHFSDNYECYIGNETLHHQFHSLSQLVHLINKLASSGNCFKTVTKVLSVLSSITAGIIGAIYGSNTTVTSITSTVSIALSALADRVAGINESARIARLILLISSSVRYFWDIKDMMISPADPA